MYESSRNLKTFYIAGFQHHGGAMVLSKLKPGKNLKLVAEPDNPYDPEAVAIMYKDVRLGYIPRELNGDISLLMRFGHGDAFECRVAQVNPLANPWEQVRATIFVTDARGKSEK